MKPAHTLTAGLILLPALFLLGQGGSLTPPGAPAPTMKKLDQIASTGIAINATNTPGDGFGTEFLVGQGGGGSYYLTGNITTSNGRAIRVVSPNVTIDLNGFRIRHITGSGVVGIDLDSGAMDCTIKNGSVTGFLIGIRIVGAERGSLHDLRVSGCTTGFQWFGQVERCTASVNSGDGFVGGGLVANCVAIRNGGRGFSLNTGTLVNSHAEENTGDGISAGPGSTLANCSSSYNTGKGIIVGAGSTLTNCASNTNTGDGISAGSGSTVSGCSVKDNLGIYGIFCDKGNTLTNCTAMDNTGTYGIFAGEGSTLIGCTAYSNDVEFGMRADDRSTLTNCTTSLNTSAAADSRGISTGAQCTISNCTVNGNLNTNGTPTGSTGGGILAGGSSTVKECTVVGNKGDGIQITSDSRVAGNNCDSNGFGGGDAAGIHSTGADNRIEANNVTDNTRGIDVDSSGTLIIKNSAASNTTNYEIAANNVFGAILDRTAPASAAVSGNTAPSSAGTTDPWANFSY